MMMPVLRDHRCIWLGDIPAFNQNQMLTTNAVKIYLEEPAARSEPPT